MLYGSGGVRYATVPRDLGLADEIVPGPGDTLFAAGAGWSAGISAFETARNQGARTVALCHDLIPVTHPHLYPPDIAASVRSYWRRTFPLLDRVIATSNCIANDIRDYCQSEGIATPELVPCTLGFDPPGSPPPTAPLPGGLQPAAYALFVSTIEPRKGHAMLLRAWSGLCARGVPQRTGFRLVLVERRGWMVDDVMADLANPDQYGGTVMHLRHVDDSVLEQLYRNAAFCLYPSHYEGFGLPIVEAFARGKPVLASTGGAVAETAGAFAPLLDPFDAAAWAGAIESWITAPAERAPYAERMQTRFHHSAWPEAAAGILDAAIAEMHQPSA